MIGLSNVFRASSLREKCKRVEMLDPVSGHSQIAADGATEEEAMRSLLDKVLSVFRVRGWEPTLLERGGGKVTFEEIQAHRETLREELREVIAELSEEKRIKVLALVEDLEGLAAQAEEEART